MRKRRQVAALQRENLMQRCVRYCLLCLLVCLLALSGIFGQSRKRLSVSQNQSRDASQSARKAHGPKAKSPRPNLAKEPTLYVVGYAHLDTEWRWEYPQTIQEYLTKTMRNNFMLFEKYPGYVFNFTGSNRYRMMKEYYPADFEKLKQYVAAGRWFPAGSSVEEGDVNTPSAESILRQILYGNNWFRKEFGIASDEYMLPDCFGFPASLPSILAHAWNQGILNSEIVVSMAARASRWWSRLSSEDTGWNSFQCWDLGRPGRKYRDCRVEPAQLWQPG